MGAIIWPLLIYWLAMFIACFTIVEVGHDFFYDEVTPHAGWKVAGGSLIFAILLTWLRPSFDTMFTAELPWTVLQGIVWFAVFTFVFQFHPQHAAAVGIVALLLLPGLATMGVDSLTNPEAAARVRNVRQATKPVRRSLGPSNVPPAPGQKAPAEKAPAEKAPIEKTPAEKK